MVHALMPLAIVTMLAVMRNIDDNLPKAASTLGARGGQSFWRVYFPLSLPGVGAGALLVFHRLAWLLHHPRPARQRARDHDRPDHH